MLTLPHSVWPSSTLDFRYAGSYARLPMSLLSEGNWFMKCVLSCSPASPSAGLEERKTVAYAQYRLPLPLWENVRAENGGGIQAEVTEEMKEEFAREYAESCTAGGEPRGMRLEVVGSCGPAMREANRRCFPGDRESYISTSAPSFFRPFPRCEPRRCADTVRSSSARPSQNPASLSAAGRGHAAHALGKRARRSRRIEGLSGEYGIRKEVVQRMWLCGEGGGEV